MAGWWEGQQARVLCYTLHTDVTTMAWAYGLKNLILPGDLMPISGMPFDMARNQACQICLQNGYTHLFSLDSDVIPPRDAILKLLATGKPFVSGLYCRRSPPHAVPVMMKDGQWVTKFKPDSLVEVDVVGAGCLLISADLLRKCPPQRPGHHWFDWRVNMQGLMPPDQCLSEDYTLCRHVKAKLGISTYVHTGVKCRHVGNFECTYGNAQPLNTTSNT